MRIPALLLVLAALAPIAGCANTGRTAPPGAPTPVAAPASETAAPAVHPESTRAASLPAHLRFAVIQSAAPAAVGFEDPELGDLRAPTRVLGDRVLKGLKYGASPGAIFMVPGAPPEMAVAGLLLGAVGGAIGAVTGLVAGAVEDGVNQAGIPLDQLYLHTPALVAAASDLVAGPRPLGECVAERLAAPPALSQLALADADEAPNVAALATQGFSHAVLLEAIEIRLVRDGDRRSYAPKARAHYSVYEIDDEPRLLWRSTAHVEGPARSLAAWTADGASELRALAARACPALADGTGAEVAARLAPTEK